MVDIVFVTDYVCPYCYVAKVALQKALEETGIEARITIQPYELTIEPAPRVDTYHDPVRREHYQVLVEPCRQMGIDMKLPPNVVPRPYTHLAFEGWLYALEHGKGDEYNDAMYRAYFIDEKDIGDVRVICKVAAKVGLDPYAIRGALVDGVYSDYEREMVMYAKRELKPRGVPTIYMNGDKLMLNSYTVDEMVGLLKAHDDDRVLADVLAAEAREAEAVAVDASCDFYTVGGHIPDHGAVIYDFKMAEAARAMAAKAAAEEAAAEKAVVADSQAVDAAGDVMAGCGPDGCGGTAAVGVLLVAADDSEADDNVAWVTGCGPDGCR